jgi:hypothetical protein
VLKLNESDKYEVLEHLPPYGTMYIPISDNGIDDYSEGFVVKFKKSDGKDWIANFKKGSTDFNNVFAFKDSILIVVIAGGTCYIMHREEQKPRSAFGVGFKSILEKENGGIILEDNTTLTIIEPNGEYWHSEQISFDGLAKLKIYGTTVNGLSYEPTVDDNLWIYFTLDLNTREINGGSYNLIFGNKKIHLKNKI